MPNATLRLGTRGSLLARMQSEIVADSLRKLHPHLHIELVIHKTSGVQYHPGHVWRLLKTMGWSRQRPARRAKEQDPKATERWLKHRWPQVKKTPNDVALG